MLPVLQNSIANLPPNTALPALPVWRAPSFWLQALFVLTGLLNVAGIDLMAILAGMGLGSSPAEVVASGERAVSLVQQLLMILFGVWSYIERKAPHFRLVFWKGRP